MDARIVPGVITALVVGGLLYARRRFVGDDAVKGDLVVFTIRGSGTEAAIAKAGFPAASEGMLVVYDVSHNRLTGGVMVLSDGVNVNIVDLETYPELAHVRVDRSTVTKISSRAVLDKLKAMKKENVPITGAL